MKPNDGRLQTAEHILLRILKDRFGVVPGISRSKEDHGFLEVVTQKDLRHIDEGTLTREVNRIIRLGLEVKRVVVSREDAKTIADLRKVPASATQIEIVDIDSFDRSPCTDPHVSNTLQIGSFEMIDVARVGRDRYRFSFKVE
jgi:Ser-tRNA(Ala) deacylase AlaX